MVKRQRNWNNCMQNTIKFGECDPDCYEELEYGENAYKEFMKDIKKALKMRVKLTDIYPPVDDEF